MGTCESVEDKDAHARNLEIEAELQKEMEHETVKLLLLGASASGKSTILKQMR